MNKKNANKLWKFIQEAGDYLVGQLPDHPNHPKGRNPMRMLQSVSKVNLKQVTKIFLMNNLMK